MREPDTWTRSANRPLHTPVIHDVVRVDGFAAGPPDCARDLAAMIAAVQRDMRKDIDEQRLETGSAAVAVGYRAIEACGVEVLHECPVGLLRFPRVVQELFPVPVWPDR